MFLFISTTAVADIGRVKNLIKVFQLDSLDQVEINPDTSPTWSDTVSGNLNVEIIGSAHDYDSATWQRTLKPTISRATAQSTVRTVRTLGSKKGTLTLARMKGNLRRPVLSELFNVDQPVGIDGPAELGVPQNTPMKPKRGDGTIGKGILKGQGADMGTIRAGKLLEALLPLAAHLVPLPFGDDEDLEDDEDMNELEQAQKMLAYGLEQEGLELVVSISLPDCFRAELTRQMLFEEEPILACNA